MKKVVKILFAVVLTVSVCLSLCSCIDIKSIKQSQAYYTDESAQEITFDGKLYKKVEDWPDDVEAFLPEYGTVSDKEKPLLVSAVAGEEMTYNQAKEILFISGSGYFCLSEKYDEIVSSLGNIQLDKYCLKKYSMDSIFDDFSEEIVFAEEDMASAIEEIIKTVKPTDEYIESWDYVSIFKCDATKTFIEEYVTISRTQKGKYYIEKSVYDEKEEYDTILYYRIPAQKEHLFKELLNNMEDYF